MPERGLGMHIMEWGTVAIMLCKQLKRKKFHIYIYIYIYIYIDYLYLYGGLGFVILVTMHGEWQGALMKIAGHHGLF